MEVNISRTALAADWGSPGPSGAAPTTADLNESLKIVLSLVSSRTGHPPQLVDRFNYYLFRYIMHDLDFANLQRQNKVHHAITSLLVRLQPAQHIAAARFNLGQRPQAAHRISDAGGSSSVDSLHPGRDFRRRNHPPGHRLAVQEAPVFGFRFQRVADGVTEIQ